MGLGRRQFTRISLGASRILSLLPVIYYSKLWNQSPLQSVDSVSLFLINVTKARILVTRSEIIQTTCFFLKIQSGNHIGLGRAFA